MKNFIRLAILLLVVFVGATLWMTYALPRFAAIDVSVDKNKAIGIARAFVGQQYNVDLSTYQHAVIFRVDDDSDRYLQKTLGVHKAQEFLKAHDIDLFFWVVRFFKERQKEEFKVVVSSRTGQVLGARHEIDETASRASMDKEKAQALAWSVLAGRFDFDEAQFNLHADDSKKRKNRTDYTFTWATKGVEIPWTNQADGGSAKLLSMVSVSGDDVLFFQKYFLEIPDGFSRHINSQKETGENLLLIFKILYLALLTFAIMLVVNRKQHAVPRAVKPFYIRIGIFLIVLMIVDIFNSCNDVMFSYPTPQSFFDYMVRQMIEGVINPIFVVIAFILPGLAGESLRYEFAPKHPVGAFLSYVRTAFMTRALAFQVVVGYATCVLVLGLQAAIFSFGYKYFGVWDEFSWLTSGSTAVLPAFSALLVGVQAAVSEEVMFRLFAINLLKRFGCSSLIAVIISSIVWGFGHTGYPVYPMWFRGVEVSSLGLIFGFVYLRFGIVATIMAHFLLDAFLNVMPYLLKPTFGLDFYASIAVLILPIILALSAYIKNARVIEVAMDFVLTAQQQFNLGILKVAINSKDVGERAIFKQQLLKNGWDPIVVDKAFNSNS